MGDSVGVKTAINRTMDILQEHKKAKETLKPGQDAPSPQKGGEKRKCTECGMPMYLVPCGYAYYICVSASCTNTRAARISTLQADLAEKIEQVELLELDIGICKDHCRNAEKTMKELSDARNEVDRLRRENADIRAEAV